MLTNFVARTDIEKVFLMVGIKPEDREMLRFLWLKDPLANKPEIVKYRFNRHVFGLRPSPSILGETIAHHLNLFKQVEPEMCELLRKSLYVDDLLTVANNDEKAFTVYQKSKSDQIQYSSNSMDSVTPQGIERTPWWRGFWERLVKSITS